MKISLTVKFSSQKPSLFKISADEYIITLNEKPYHGNANKALRRYLSDVFDVSLSSIRIVTGLKSHHKIVEIGQ